MEGRELSRVVALATAVGLLAACGQTGPTREEAMPQLRFETTVDEAIDAVSDTGEPVPVSEVTDVEWDEVALFTEGTTRSEIEAVVGASGLNGDRYLSSTNLLVLRADGAVVGLIGTTPDVMDGPYGVLLGPGAAFTAAGDGYVTLAEQ